MDTSRLISAERDERRTMSEQKEWMRWMSHRSEVRRLFRQTMPYDETAQRDADEYDLIVSMRDVFDAASAESRQGDMEYLKERCLKSLRFKRGSFFKPPAARQHQTETMPIVQTSRRSEPRVTLR